MAISGLSVTLLVLYAALFPMRAQPAQQAYPTAVAHVQQGRFAAAIPILEKILAATPGDLKARNLLGIALMSSGRGAEANAQFRKALEIDPRFHPALKNLAVNELALGQSKEAKAHFEKAVKIVPNDAVVH